MNSQILSADADPVGLHVARRTGPRRAGPRPSPRPRRLSRVQRRRLRHAARLFARGVAAIIVGGVLLLAAAGFGLWLAIKLNT